MQPDRNEAYIPPPATDKKTYWGFWATIGFSLLIFILFSLLQFIFLLAYAYTINSGNITAENLEHILKSLSLNGDAISVAEIPSALIGTALVIIIAYSHKTLAVKDYLDLKPPGIFTLLKWLGFMVLLIITLEAVNIALNRETPDFMGMVYNSATNLPLLWIAVVLMAPLFEEFLFRGFMLEGLRHSFVGTAGAIIISSAIWAIIHAQYELFEVFTIFLIGIAFAIAKLRSGSLYVPMAMHLLMNLSASVLMEISTVQQ